jgi:hypothetical protein
MPNIPQSFEKWSGLQIVNPPFLKVEELCGGPKSISFSRACLGIDSPVLRHETHDGLGESTFRARIPNTWHSPSQSLAD